MTITKIVQIAFRLIVLLFIITACSLTPSPTDDQRTPNDQPPTLPALGEIDPDLPAVTSTPTPQRATGQAGQLPADPATISGLVWADVCQPTTDGTTGAGCVSVSEVGFRADGLIDEGEAGLGGVQVRLRAGECPGSEVGFATTVTETDGQYQFTNLQPGRYCISIDPVIEPNLSRLVPGDWTHPAAGVGQTTIIIKAGETLTANFGWEFEPDPARPPQSPLPATSETADVPCINRAVYVADVTIPDNTLLPPGEPFVKTWRVRNESNCTWGTNYSLMFDSGDQLNAPSFVPLPQSVLPGNTVDVSVSMTAPTTNGRYRSNWKIRSPEGQIFGSRGDNPLYVQIVVAQRTNPAFPMTPAPPQAGTPTPAAGAIISGLVWADDCRLVADGTPAVGCRPLEGGGYQADGKLNQGELPIAGVELTLKTGYCPGQAPALSRTETNQQGLYRFENLLAGPYCVAIDPRQPPNASLLPPGDWTAPAPGVGSLTIIIGPGETGQANFGWQYQAR